MQRSGSSRHGNAAASECQQRHHERDSCSDCQGTAVPGPGTRHPSPVPVPQPTPGPQQPSPPRPAPSKPRCEKRSAVRAGGTRGLHAENTLGLLPGVPATARSGTPACRAALVPWEAPSPEHAVPRDPPPVLQPPSTTPVLAPFTSAGPVSPAPGAHRGSSAAAPPGFLHLRGGSDTAGETARGGFGLLLLLPLPSCPSVRAPRSFPQHQQGFTSLKPVPGSPPWEPNPIRSQHPRHFKPPHEGTQPGTRTGTHLPRCRHCPRCARPAPACPCPAPAEGDKGAVGATPSWCWTASQKEHHRVALGTQTRYPPVPLTSLTRSVLCSLPATTPSGCPWGLLILPGDREGGGSGVAASPCQPHTSLDGDPPKKKKTPGASQQAQAGGCPPKHLHIFKDIPSAQEQL